MDSVGGFLFLPYLPWSPSLSSLCLDAVWAQRDGYVISWWQENFCPKKQLSLLVPTVLIDVWFYHLISERLRCPCLFSSQGKCRMVALGGSSLLCPTDDLTWPSIIGPLSPPLVPWWCLPMSLFLLYCMLAQYTYKPFFYQSYKWKVKSKSPHGYDLKLSGAFLLYLPQSLQELGAELRTCLDGLSPSPLSAAFPIGSRAIFFSFLGGGSPLSSFLPTV